MTGSLLKTQSSHIVLTLAATLFAPAIWVWAQTGEQAEPLPEMPAKVYDKVLPVMAKIDCDNGFKIGSGSVVGHSYGGRVVVILTACHVVASNFDDARADRLLDLSFHQDLRVKIGKDSTFVRAVVLPKRYDLANDLALIAARSPVAHAATIRYNRSGGVKPGRKVAAFGFPDSDQLSQTVGRIKRLEENLLVFDAQIAPGSSGGPLIDKAGRMIGLSVQRQSGETVGEGFAVPMDLVLSVVDPWLKNMKLTERWKRQRLPSFWQRMYSDPLFLLTEAGMIGGATYLIMGPPEDKIFGEPPSPAETK